MPKRYVVNLPRTSIEMVRVNLPSQLCVEHNLAWATYPLFLEGHGAAGEGAVSSNRSLTGMGQIFQLTGCEVGDHFEAWVEDNGGVKEICFAFVERANHEQRAARAWPILTAAAKDQKTISYGDLADAISIHPRPLRYVLGPIQDYCLTQKLPPLTSLVIHATGDGLPGLGFIAWDISSLADGQKQVFNFDWASVPNPFAYALQGETQEKLAERLVVTPTATTDVYQLVKVRGIAQMIFRQALLKAYGGACAFCGLSFTQALDAAHIHRWSDCAPSDRVNVRNGLLLCSNHHELFDAHLLQITEDFKIAYADPAKDDGPYSEMDEHFSVKLHGKEIRLPKPELRPDVALIRKRYGG
jgi:putative restriction endonuclease